MFFDFILGITVNSRRLYGVLFKDPGTAASIVSSLILQKVSDVTRFTWMSQRLCSFLVLSMVLIDGTLLVS